MDAPQRTGSTHLLSRYFRSNLDAKPVVIKDKVHSTTKEERLLEQMNLIQKNWHDNAPIITQENFNGVILGDAYPTKTGIELFSLAGNGITRILLKNPVKALSLEVPDTNKIPNEINWKSFGCVAATKHHIATNGPENNAIYLFDNGMISNELPVNNFKNTFLVDEGDIQQLYIIGSSLFARVLKKETEYQFKEWLYVFDIEDPEKKPVITFIPNTIILKNVFCTWGHLQNQLCFGNTHVLGVKKLDHDGYQLFAAPLTSLNVKNEQSPFCLFEEVDSIAVPHIFAEDDHFIAITKTKDHKFNVHRIDLKDGFTKEMIAQDIELLEEGFTEHMIFYYLGRLFSAQVKGFGDRSSFSSFDLATGMKKDLGTSSMALTKFPLKPRFFLSLDRTKKVATVSFVRQGMGKVSVDAGLGAHVEILTQITRFEYAPDTIQENASNSQALVIKA